MDDAQAKRIIEALLFVAGQPLALKRLAEVLPDLEAAAIRRLIETLNGEYAASGRAFLVQEVAGGYQLVTDPQLAPWVRRALQQPKPDSVSAAALETLVERRFARVAGRKESPGRPFLYGTTAEFLRHFGLRSLEALPAMTQPTVKEPGADAPVPHEPAAATHTD